MVALTVGRKNTPDILAKQHETDSEMKGLWRDSVCFTEFALHDLQEQTVKQQQVALRTEVFCGTCCPNFDRLLVGIRGSSKTHRQHSGNSKQNEQTKQTGATPSNIERQLCGLN